jgi:hypothetical protein
MNLMTLQRYKNEIILLLSILFALFAFVYKLSANTYVKENKANIQQQVQEIHTISNLKKQWGGKNLANKVKTLKSVVSASKIKSFNKKSKKLAASYVGLSSNELNKVTNKLINMPVQIVLLNITKSSKNQYTMEFTCKW